MKLLLDTQLAFWWQADRRRLPAAAMDLVLGTEDPVLVSRASLWELAIKAGLGKVRVDLPVFARRVTEIGFAWLEISGEHILRVASLPLHDDHKDPFDRLLVAQSLTEPAILLTTDAKLARYGSTVRVV
jgi:PIN domain nuclease of toxin-antitoxin system